MTAGGLPLDVDRGATPPQAFLAPGAYHLEVTHGTVGYFETSVLAEDRRRVDVEVEFRPALAFLGVLGGDAAQSEAVRSGTVPAWAPICCATQASAATVPRTGQLSESVWRRLRPRPSISPSS